METDKQNNAKILFELPRKDKEGLKKMAKDNDLTLAQFLRRYIKQLIGNTEFTNPNNQY